jgi:hypothetical protein
MVRKSNVPEDTIMVARESFAITHEGHPVFVKMDKTTARAGHPIVQANPSLWMPQQVIFELDGYGHLAKPDDDPAAGGPVPPVNPTRADQRGARSRTTT